MRLRNIFLFLSVVLIFQSCGVLEKRRYSAGWNINIEIFGPKEHTAHNQKISRVKLDKLPLPTYYFKNERKVFHDSSQILMADTIVRESKQRYSPACLPDKHSLVINSSNHVSETEKIESGPDYESDTYGIIACILLCIIVLGGLFIAFGPYIAVTLVNDLIGVGLAAYVAALVLSCISAVKRKRGAIYRRNGFLKLSYILLIVIPIVSYMALMIWLLSLL